jgi:hypothetical protein
VRIILLINTAYVISVPVPIYLFAFDSCSALDILAEKLSVFSSFCPPSCVSTSNHRLIRIFPRKYTQSLQGEGEFVVCVFNRTTLVENTLDGFMQPFSVGLLPVHDELYSLLDWVHVRIVSMHQTDQGPCCHDHLRANWMFGVHACFARLFSVRQIITMRSRIKYDLRDSFRTSHHLPSAWRSRSRTPF